MARNQLDYPHYTLFSHKPTDTPRVTARLIDYIACLSRTDQASEPLLHVQGARLPYKCFIKLRALALANYLFPFHHSSLLFRPKMRLPTAPLLLFAALGAFAAPTESTLEKRQIQTISPGDVAAFKPYSFYAASAYCEPSVLKTWTCGGTWMGFYRGVLNAHRHIHHSQLQCQLWLPTHFGRR